MAERWCSEAKSKASPTAMGLLMKALFLQYQHLRVFRDA